MKIKNLLLPSFAVISILLGMSLLGYLPVEKFWPPTFSTSEAGSDEIVIHARGTNGQEKVALYINDQPVQFWDLTTQFGDYTYVPPTEITINKLAVEFINDRWEPENGINYDAQIDYITVNGTRYDSEHASTASTGSWDQNNWCAPGNKSTEWLHCTGGFTYNVPAGTVVGINGGGGGSGGPVCSNGQIETGEQCDDGNTTSNDGCSSICQTETASNGITNLRIDGITQTQAVLRFDIDPVVDSTVEIDKGSGWEQLSNSGQYASHTYDLHNQTSLTAGTSYTVRVTPLGKTLQTVEFTTQEAGTPPPPPPVGGGSFPESSAFRVDTDALKNSSAPGLRSSVNEQYTTKTTRVSTPAMFSNGRATHSYSRRAVWNIDESLMYYGYKIVDANNYTIIKGVPFNSETMWSNTDPDLMYGILGSDSSKFARFNVRTGATDTIYDFPTSCQIGSAEGYISLNDRYVVIDCGSVLYSLDISAKQILGTSTKKSNYNWAGFTPSGDYILVENNNGSGVREIRRFNRNFQNETQLTDDRSHGDIGTDANGDDVMVMISWDHIDSVRVKDKKRTTLTEGANTSHGHISCRSIRRPGYCYFSSNAGPVGSVSLSTGQVELFGFTRSASSTYAAQPKATASPTGRKIIFTSDWYGKESISDYVVEVR